MHSDECIAEIAKLTTDATGRPLDQHSRIWLSRPDFKGDVSDAASICSLRGAQGTGDLIVLISNSAFPDAVSNAAAQAEQCAHTLPADLSRHILLPIHVGFVDEKSFAVYPRLHPFEDNKLLCKLQKAVVKPAIYTWLGNVTKVTKRPVLEEAIEDRYIKPLDYVSNEKRFSDIYRSSAAEALEALTAHEFQPVSVVQHGDFWLGNILLHHPFPIAPQQQNFSIIDWGASNIAGYPFADLIRFYDSTSHRVAELQKQLLKYSHTSAIPIEDMGRYLTAAFGYLGLHREQFPKDRYIKLSERCIGLGLEAQKAFTAE